MCYDFYEQYTKVTKIADVVLKRRKMMLQKMLKIMSSTIYPCKNMIGMNITLVENVRWTKCWKGLEACPHRKRQTMSQRNLLDDIQTMKELYKGLTKTVDDAYRRNQWTKLNIQC